MIAIDLKEAQSHLVQLIEKAVNGEPFMIESAGKPLVQVMAVPASVAKPNRRVGFMDGQFQIPDDFDTMHQRKIIDLFEGNE